MEHVVFLSPRSIFVTEWQAARSPPLHSEYTDYRFFGSELKTTLHLSQLHYSLMLKAQDAGS